MKNTKNTIEVTLHIFSGEPNPKWVLTETQVDELKKRLSILLPPDSPKLIPTGYGGLIIRNPGNAKKIPDKLHAYDGVLAITDKGIINHYKDVVKLEEWLLNQAHEQGLGDAIKKRRGYNRK